MLRITISPGEPSATVKLEGRVAAESVEELRRICERLLAGNGYKRVILDLASVSFVDSAGIELFRNLHQRDVVLTGCSPFVGELLKEVLSC